MKDHEDGFAGILFILILVLTVVFLYIAYKEQKKDFVNQEQSESSLGNQVSPTVSTQQLPTNTQKLQSNPNSIQNSTQFTPTPIVQYSLSPTQSYSQTTQSLPVNTATPTSTSKRKGNSNGETGIVTGG